MTNIISRQHFRSDAYHKTDWKHIMGEIKDSLKWFERQQIKPTLRTMFYRLVSLEIIPNTQQSYKTLSSTTVKARKLGQISWDCFSDQGRLVIGDFKEEYRSPNQHIQLGINFLKNASKNYTIPRWYKQLHYVEVWIEKQALADTFSSFLEDRQVKVIVNRGYAGWSFLYENYKRLRKIKDEDNKSVHVQYFGDFDPSGVDMDRHLQESFACFGLQDNEIDFQRVAVTQEQINRFSLPPIPNNQETLDKVNNDTRTKKFREKHGGKLFVVELDALLAVVPEEFKRIVQQSVDQFFDTHTHEKLLREHPHELIDRLVNKKIRFLDR